MASRVDRELEVDKTHPHPTSWNPDGVAQGGEANVSPGAKKIVTWLAIAFVAFYLITRPEDAADAIRGIAGFFGNAFESLIRFVTSTF